MVSRWETRLYLLFLVPTFVSQKRTGKTKRFLIQFLETWSGWLTTIYQWYNQPRLQDALSLKQKGPLKGMNGNRGRKRDIKGTGDPKSEEEKETFWERSSNLQKVRKNRPCGWGCDIAYKRDFANLKTKWLTVNLCYFWLFKHSMKYFDFVYENLWCIIYRVIL